MTRQEQSQPYGEQVDQIRTDWNATNKKFRKTEAREGTSALSAGALSSAFLPIALETPDNLKTLLSSVIVVIFGNETKKDIKKLIKTERARRAKMKEANEEVNQVRENARKNDPESNFNWNWREWHVDKNNFNMP